MECISPPKKGRVCRARHPAGHVHSDLCSHAAAIAQAIKASGVVVRVETPDFLRLLNRQDEPIVVRAPGGFFQASWRYLTTYKGLAFLQIPMTRWCCQAARRLST